MRKYPQPPVDTLQLLVTKDENNDPIGANELKALIDGSGLANDEKVYMKKMLLDNFYDATPLEIGTIGEFNLNKEQHGLYIPDMVSCSGTDSRKPDASASRGCLRGVSQQPEPLVGV